MPKPDDMKPDADLKEVGEFLDLLKIPDMVVDAGGTPQPLTLSGRVAKIVTDRDALEVRAIAAETALQRNGPEALLEAKVLLAEAFKWLQALENSVDIRQKIILFMERTK